MDALLPLAALLTALGAVPPLVSWTLPQRRARQLLQDLSAEANLLNALPKDVIERNRIQMEIQNNIMRYTQLRARVRALRGVPWVQFSMIFIGVAALALTLILAQTSVSSESWWDQMETVLQMGGLIMVALGFGSIIFEIARAVFVIMTMSEEDAREMMEGVE